MRVQVLARGSGALLAVGLLLLSGVSPAPRVQAQPPPCDNKCRHRFDFKDNGGTCVRYGLDTCWLCTGNYNLCKPQDGDKWTGWTCRLVTGKDNLRYTTEECTPVCPWAGGGNSETNPQAGEMNGKVAFYYTCQP